MCDHAPVLQVSQCLPRSVPAWLGDMPRYGTALAASYNQAFITLSNPDHVQIQHPWSVGYNDSLGQFRVCHGGFT